MKQERFTKLVARLAKKHGLKGNYQVYTNVKDFTDDDVQKNDKAKRIIGCFQVRKTEQMHIVARKNSVTQEKREKFQKVLAFKGLFVEKESVYLNTQNVLHEIAHALVFQRMEKILPIKRHPWMYNLLGSHGIFWRLTAWSIGYEFPKFGMTDMEARKKGYL